MTRTILTIDGLSRSFGGVHAVARVGAGNLRGAGGAGGGV